MAMQELRVRGGVCAVSRKPSDVPLVVGSDGSVFVNVLHCFSGERSPESLLDRACSEPGDVLVAVKLRRGEIQKIRDRLRHGANEAIAFTLGARTRLARRRKSRGGGR